jgi:hypothetical protein
MSTSNLASARGRGDAPGVIVTPFELRDYALLLRWLILAGVAVAAFVAVWQFGLLAEMLRSDKSYISLAITLLFVGTSVHCATGVVAVSRELNAARRVQRLIQKNPSNFQVMDDKVVIGEGVQLLPGIMTDHIRNLILKARGLESRVDQSLLMRTFADGLRGRLQVGWFISDAMFKLGLLGTLIGFIFMLSPINAIKTFDPLTMKAAMSTMSSGMAVALYTTLAGLVGGLILKLEYYFLEIGTTELHTITAETTDVYVIPGLREKSNAS